MKIREMLKNNISRGKVEVYLSVEDGGEKEKKLLVNTVLAKRYKEEIEKLSKELDLPFNLSGNSLLFYPEVFHLTEEEDEDNENGHPGDSGCGHSGVCSIPLFGRREVTGRP